MIELKLEKDRKLKNGCYCECIAKDCENKANACGFCWKHFDEYNNEQPKENNEMSILW